MIHLLRLALPYSFLLFFVYKGIRQPLYLLGIPFLMYMSESIFVDTAKLFQIPGRLGGQLLFIWLILLWIVSKFIQKDNPRNLNENKITIIDFCVAGLIIITIIGLISTISDYYPSITNVIRQFLTLLSLLAGYFIIKNWISSNKPEILVEFLYSLVIINSIAAVLFILHQGLHLSIYEQKEYISDSFEGTEITRSFFFMPQFLFFSIVYLLVFTKKYTFSSIGLLLINLLAIFITYTRSFVTITVVSVLLYFVLTGLKNGKLGKAIKNLMIYLILGVFGIFLLSKFLPASTAFFEARFSEMSEKQYTYKEPDNLEYRFTNTKATITNMDRNKRILGMGAITWIQSPQVVEMDRTTSDMVWAGVIFRWGFAGLALFILIYISSTIKAFKIFVKSEGIISDLALMIFLYIISQVMESFVSWTFLSGHGLATGLWYFAILSSLTILEKNNENASKIRFS